MISRRNMLLGAAACAVVPGHSSAQNVLDIRRSYEAIAAAANAAVEYEWHSRIAAAAHDRGMVGDLVAQRDRWRQGALAKSPNPCYRASP